VPKSGKISERLLKTLRKSGAFQAEYEGSIPFTRSIVQILTMIVPDSAPAKVVRRDGCAGTRADCACGGLTSISCISEGENTRLLTMPYGTPGLATKSIRLRHNVGE
jgi:hypothetical protein